MNDEKTPPTLSEMLKLGLDYLSQKIDKDEANAADLAVYRKLVLDYHEAKLKEEQKGSRASFASRLRLAVHNESRGEVGEGVLRGD